MLRSEAVSQMKLLMGFRRNLDVEAVQCLRTAQTDLESRPTKPWFLQSEDSTVRCAIADQRLLQPIDFLQEYEEGALSYLPDDATLDEVQLVKNDFDDLKALFPRTQTGVPQAYAATGTYFRLFPIPDAQYLIQLKYYKKGSILDIDIENEWLRWAPMLIMGVAGQYLAASARDTVAQNEFRVWEQKGTAVLMAANEERKHTNRTYQIGGEE